MNEHPKGGYRFGINTMNKKDLKIMLTIDAFTILAMGVMAGWSFMEGGVGVPIVAILLATFVAFCMEIRWKKLRASINASYDLALSAALDEAFGIDRDGVYTKEIYWLKVGFKRGWDSR